MRKLLTFGFIALVWLSAQPAQAIDLTMTSIGLSNNLGGFYIGPYTVMDDASKQTFQVICDDFLADTNIEESWTANVSNLTALTGKFADTTTSTTTADSLQKYDEVAFLANTLLSGGSCLLSPVQCAGVNVAGDIQYALWQVFDSTGVDTALSHLSGYDLADATAWLSLAASQSYYPGEYSNVVIYTATQCLTGPGCVPGTATNLPQEFVAVRTPEPGTLLLFGAALAFIALYWRPQPVGTDRTN